MPVTLLTQGFRHVEVIRLFSDRFASLNATNTTWVSNGTPAGRVGLRGCVASEAPRGLPRAVTPAVAISIRLAVR